MAKGTKLVTKFKTLPKDFTWAELVTMLGHLGFAEIQGSGSRVKFYNKQKNCLIQLHKPHPAKILKSYAMKEILTVLEMGKMI